MVRGVLLICNLVLFKHVFELEDKCKREKMTEFKDKEVKMVIFRLKKNYGEK